MKKKLITILAIALLFLGLGLNFSTKVEAKSVNYFTTYHQNTITGNRSNYKYYYKNVADAAYIRYVSTGYSNGGWNYTVQEVYYHWQ